MYLRKGNIRQQPHIHAALYVRTVRPAALVIYGPLLVEHDAILLVKVIGCKVIPPLRSISFGQNCGFWTIQPECIVSGIIDASKSLPSCHVGHVPI